MTLRREPGAGIGREFATGERAEAELQAFASRRHERRVKDEGEAHVEDLWEARERLEVARRRRELDVEWLRVAPGPGGPLQAIVGRARGRRREARGGGGGVNTNEQRSEA